MDYREESVYRYIVAKLGYMDSLQYSLLYEHIENESEIDKLKEDVEREEIEDFFSWFRSHIGIVRKSEPEKYKNIFKEVERFLCYDGSYDEYDRDIFRQLFDRSEDPEDIKLFLSEGSFRSFAPKRRELAEQTRVDRDKLFFLIGEANNRYADSGITNENTDDLIDKLAREKHAASMINDFYPTVAMMGMTMAGKSTLFHAISGKMRRFIGKGGHRSSKISIGTYRKGMMLVDTPGLGAAIRKGREDERKAYDVLRYADRVCVVTSNDSLSPVISELVDELIRRKKQFCLVVNNKGFYLDEESKLKDYLKSKGKIFRGGSGFFEPIREKLEKAGAPIIYVWPEAINSLAYMKRLKSGFKMSIRIWLNFRRIVRYSGIKELERYMRNFDENMVDRRTALFDDITNMVLNDINDFIEKENEELRGLDVQIAETQKKIKPIEKDIDKLIDKYFKKTYYNRYSKEDIYDRFGKLHTKKATEEFNNFINEMINTPEFTGGMDEIMKKLPILEDMTQESPVSSKGDKVKGRKLLYGYEVMNFYKWAGHAASIGGRISSATPLGVALAGTGFVCNVVADKNTDKLKNKFKQKRTEEVYESVTQAMDSAKDRLKSDYKSAIDNIVDQWKKEIDEYQKKQRSLISELNNMPNLARRLKDVNRINVQE